MQKVLVPSFCCCQIWWSRYVTPQMPPSTEKSFQPLSCNNALKGSHSLPGRHGQYFISSPYRDCLADKNFYTRLGFSDSFLFTFVARWFSTKSAVTSSYSWEVLTRTTWTWWVGTSFPKQSWGDFGLSNWKPADTSQGFRETMCNLRCVISQL